MQAKIIKLLLNLQEKKGLARKASDRMAVMLAGRIVEEGPISQVLAAPKHAFIRDMVQNSQYGRLCLRQ